MRLLIALCCLLAAIAAAGLIGGVAGRLVAIVGVSLLR